MQGPDSKQAVDDRLEILVEFAPELMNRLPANYIAASLKNLIPATKGT